MKIIFALLLLSFSFCTAITAQVSVKYRSQNYIGLLEGEAKGAFQLQTIHGVQISNWFGAVGAGLDYYVYRSIPVFISLNRDFTFNNRTFFISGDIGVNYPWVTDEYFSVWAGPSTQKFFAGLYWASGLGYKAYFKNKRDAIVLNLGYSFKHLREEQTRSAICQDPPCQVDVDRYDYRLNRISLKLGWQF